MISEVVSVCSRLGRGGLSHLVIGGLKKLTGDIDIYVVVFTQWDLRQERVWDNQFHSGTYSILIREAWFFDLPLMPDSDLLGV